MITGGLGFIGSNLARRLAGLGAELTLVDSLIPDYGGNLFNIEPIRDRITINFCDIRDTNVMNYLVKEQDFVFHLAGQVAVTTSAVEPREDLEVNLLGTFNVLEAIRSLPEGSRPCLLFTSTNKVYG